MMKYDEEEYYSVEEEEFCMNCGDTHFHESRVQGICIACFGSLTERELT